MSAPEAEGLVFTRCRHGKYAIRKPVADVFECRERDHHHSGLPKKQRLRPGGWSMGLGVRRLDQVLPK